MCCCSLGDDVIGESSAVPLASVAAVSAPVPVVPRVNVRFGFPVAASAAVDTLGVGGAAFAGDDVGSGAIGMRGTRYVDR